MQSPMGILPGPITARPLSAETPLYPAMLAPTTEPSAQEMKHGLTLQESMSWCVPVLKF